MSLRASIYFVSTVMVSMIVFLVFDSMNYTENTMHILRLSIEIVVILIGIVFIWSIWTQYKKLKSDFAYTKAINMDLIQINENLKSENDKRIVDIQKSINLAMDQWELTEAEKSIVLLVLKGLSNKEIAEVRKTSENTVRQQTASIYKKSNLHTRTELSAHFIQSLLSS